MASTGELDINSISKMKVAEIKKELKARGLSTAGTKTELADRLLAAASQISQDAMSDDGNAESEILDEDEVLGGEEEEGGEFDDDDLVADAVLADEPKSSSVSSAATLSVKRPADINAEAEGVQPKKRVLIRPNSVSSGKENGSSTLKTGDITEPSDTTGKKVIKLSGVTMKERLELRAQKFGVPLSDAAKKEARAERFGTTPTQSSGIKIVTATKIIVQGPNEETLKKRAERFGGNVSSTTIKIDDNDKIKKRQERFGVSAAVATTTATGTGSVTSSLEEKKRQRAERFKL